MASSESAPTFLNQERKPQFFLFWAFAHIHSQRMGWKAFYVIYMHQKKREDKSLFSSFSRNWVRVQTSYSQVDNCVAPQLWATLYDTYITDMKKLLGAIAILVIRPLWGRGRGGLDSQLHELISSGHDSWKNLHWLRGRLGEVLIQAYEIVLKRKMLDL